MTTANRTRAGKINWQEVRRRLARATAATDEALRLSPERARVVMEERARLLARVPAAVAPAAEMVEFVTFVLANERYGIETRYVREAVRFVDVTPVPGAPDFLRGVANLRGDILAVIDLRKLFNLPQPGVTDRASILILGGEHAEFGIVVDAAQEVLTLPTEEILPAPDVVAGIARAYLRGVTRDALIVLNGAVLLQDARLFIDQGEESEA
jgi:purine-binding chemotaxis protein CheW